MDELFIYAPIGNPYMIIHACSSMDFGWLLMQKIKLWINYISWKNIITNCGWTCKLDELHFILKFHEFSSMASIPFGWLQIHMTHKIGYKKNLKKFQKTRFWEEKSVEDVVTLGPMAHASTIEKLLMSRGAPRMVW